jgi:hypothetical protein
MFFPNLRPARGFAKRPSATVTLPIEPQYATPADAPSLPSGIEIWPTLTFTDTPGESSPAVARLDVSGQSGDSLTWAGDDLTSDSELQFWTTDGPIIAAENIYSDGANVRVCTISDRFAGDKFYFVYPYDPANGYGSPVVVNRAEAWRVQTESTSSKDGYVSDKAYLFGDNLTNLSGQAFIYADGYGYITPTFASHGRLEFVIPADMPQGDYDLWAHNGRGGKYGWSLEPVTLTVATPADLARNYDYFTVNIPGTHANDPSYDIADDLVAAVQAIRDNGFIGRVVLPAGHWYCGRKVAYSGGFGGPVALVGAGSGSTVLHRHASFNDDYMINMSSTNRGCVQGIKFDFADGVGTSTLTANSVVINGALELRDVIIDTRGIRNWGYTSQSTAGALVKDCTFYGQGMFFLTSDNTLVINSQFYQAARPDGAISVWGGRHHSVVGCDFDNVDFTNDDLRGWRCVVWACNYGRMKSLYFGSNTTHKLYSFEGAGDSEQVLVDGGFGSAGATVTTATSNTCRVLTADIDGFSPLANTRQAIVCGGTGTGQMAEIASTATDGSETVFTMDRDWAVTPDATSRINIVATAERMTVELNAFEGNDDTAGNSTAVHCFDGGSRVVVRNNTMSHLRHMALIWGQDKTTTVSAANLPAFYILVENNVAAHQQDGLRVENTGGLEGGQTYNFLGVTFRKNVITDVARRGFFVRTFGPGAMLVSDQNQISGMPTGVFEDEYVYGGNIVFAGSVITGDDSEGSVAVNPALAVTPITITQVPASGQFVGFEG